MLLCFAEGLCSTLCKRPMRLTSSYYRHANATTTACICAWVSSSWLRDPSDAKFILCNRYENGERCWGNEVNLSHLCKVDLPRWVELIYANKGGFMQSEKVFTLREFIFVKWIFLCRVNRFERDSDSMLYENQVVIKFFTRFLHWLSGRSRRWSFTADIADAAGKCRKRSRRNWFFPLHNHVAGIVKSNRGSLGGTHSLH